MATTSTPTHLPGIHFSILGQHHGELSPTLQLCYLLCVEHFHLNGGVRASGVPLPKLPKAAISPCPQSTVLCSCQRLGITAATGDTNNTEFLKCSNLNCV